MHFNITNSSFQTRQTIHKIVLQSFSKFTGNCASTNFRNSSHNEMKIELPDMVMKPLRPNFHSRQQIIQSLNLEKDLFMFLTKYTELALTTIDAGVVDDGRLLGEAGYSFLLPSLSSSLMVSNTFDVRRLMTLIICGGATSVTNLAIREFAITFEG